LANLKNGGDRVSEQSANLQSGAVSQTEAATLLNVSPRSGNPAQSANLHLDALPRPD
jgi:hypothetical protein